MKFKTITILTSAFLIFGLVGCKKYEFGPSMSLKTKTTRVANTWQIDFAKDLQDGTDITDDYTGEIWEFTKDDEFLENSKLKGKWVFSDSKEDIIINFLDEDVDRYKILKLKDKEMWLEILGEEELHLLPY
ncbi:MAG: hypothetical protein L3J35_03835 [Bacteroidales bacterium]|nr:hypothetical protein [Bacteroidales bacterium]